jgi:hypothetical protein
MTDEDFLQPLEAVAAWQRSGNVKFCFGWGRGRSALGLREGWHDARR